MKKANQLFTGFTCWKHTRAQISYKPVVQEPAMTSKKRTKQIKYVYHTLIWLWKREPEG